MPIFITFDQKVDPKAVLAKLLVKANGTLRATRLLTEIEIEKAHDIKVAGGPPLTIQGDADQLEQLREDVVKVRRP